MEIDNVIKAIEYLKMIRNIESVECMACGIRLSKEDMEDHDKIECFAYSAMVNKYYNII